MKYLNKYINFKLKNNQIMNLIQIKEYYQDKEHMEKYLNVKVILLMNFMQLKFYNNNKDKQILMKYKLLIILLIKKILLIIIIFIIELKN